MVVKVLFKFSLILNRSEKVVLLPPLLQLQHMFKQSGYTCTLVLERGSTSHLKTQKGFMKYYVILSTMGEEGMDLLVMLAARVVNTGEVLQCCGYTSDTLPPKLNLIHRESS